MPTLLRLHAAPSAPSPQRSPQGDGHRAYPRVVPKRARLLTVSVMLAGCAGRPSESEAQDPAAPSTAEPAAGVHMAERPDQASATAASPAPSASPPDAVETETRLDEPMGPLPDDYLAFSRACDRGAREITIAAVGDLLIHRELQKQAFRSPAHFRDLWSGVEGLISAADVSYANLEGPTAQGIDRRGNPRKDPGMVFDNRVYSGYARFNYHPVLVADLVSSGFDIVSTANNHSLDRGPLGVDRTIETLVAAKLPYTGTRRQDQQSAPWHAITHVEGITIAWLACTLHTNYQEDTLGQVLRCFDDPKTVPQLVGKLARRKDIDAVIVTPHWGKEYKHEPIGKQRRLAQAVIDAGAIAVIGSHPHVLQPWEKMTASDGREALTMFSLGNFASHQRDLPRRSSVVLYLGLSQGEDGTVWVNGARYAPITVRMEGDKESFFVERVDADGGPREVYEHIEGLMGAPNRVGDSIGTSAPPRTNPQCYSGFTTP